MLAISIRMPTSTGGPAGGAGGGVSGPGGAGAWVGGVRAPHLRSRGGGGCRSLGAACPQSPSRRTCCWARRRCGKKHKRVREATGRSPPSLRPHPGGAHLRAAHATASASGSSSARGPVRLAAAPIPAAASRGTSRGLELGEERRGETIPESGTHARSRALRPRGSPLPASAAGARPRRGELRARGAEGAEGWGRGMLRARRAEGATGAAGALRAAGPGGRRRTAALRPPSCRGEGADTAGRAPGRWSSGFPSRDRELLLRALRRENSPRCYVSHTVKGEWHIR